MKRKIAILLLIVIILSFFTSCKDKDEETTTKENTVAVETTIEDEKSTEPESSTTIATKDNTTQSTTKAATTASTTKKATTTTTTTTTTTVPTRNYYEEAKWVFNEAKKYGESLGMTFDPTITESHKVVDGWVCSFSEKDNALADVKYELDRFKNKCNATRFNLEIKDGRSKIGEEGYLVCPNYGT